MLFPLDDLLKNKGFSTQERTDIIQYAVRRKDIKTKKNFVNDSNVKIDLKDFEKLIQSGELFLFLKKKEEERRLQEEEKRLQEEEMRFLAEEEERISEIVRTMPITSSQYFEGYRITRYGGYVSGDEVVYFNDKFFGSGYNKDAINEAIKKVRIVAIEELKRAAAEIGCNAVIALDFDYINIDRQYASLSNTTNNEEFIVLTANGTAVTIEKME